MATTTRREHDTRSRRATRTGARATLVMASLDGGGGPPGVGEARCLYLTSAVVLAPTPSPSATPAATEGPDTTPTVSGATPTAGQGTPQPTSFTATPTPQATSIVFDAASGDATSWLVFFTESLGTFATGLPAAAGRTLRSRRMCIDAGERSVRLQDDRARIEPPKEQLAGLLRQLEALRR